MPKKKRNGFITFVMDWKEKNAPELSLNDAISEANAIWIKMSEPEKKTYKEQAKAASNLPNSSRKGKLACDGTPIAHIENQQQEAQAQLEHMNKTIEETIKSALNNKNLLNQRFYFVECNYFDSVLKEKKYIYIPAEVALVEFSLKTGVKRKLHAFVNPKESFYGHQSTLISHANSTHQLPLPPNAFGDKAELDIFNDILHFIRDKNTPLYTNENRMNIVKSCLQVLGNNQQSEKHKDLIVYSIQKLFYELKNATSGDTKMNKYITDAVLIRDTFQYESNIACKYHEQIDRPQYCALSQVFRWGFTFADYIGKDVNLYFIPGQHMPLRYNAKQINSDLQQAAKVDTASVHSACNAISQMSLESDNKTCDVLPLSSHKPSKKLQHAQRNTSNLSMSDIASTSNPWRRHDTSEAPDSRIFDIDYEEQRMRINTPGSVGRGIAILDDDFPSLGSNARGRGRGNSLRM